MRVTVLSLSRKLNKVLNYRFNDCVKEKFVLAFPTAIHPPHALIVQYHKDVTVYVMEVKFTIKYFFMGLTLFFTECSPPCMNGGRCVYSNTCHCPQHWTGGHCEQSLLSITYINIYTDKTSPTSTSTCDLYEWRNMQWYE